MDRAEQLERYIIETCPQRDNLTIIRTGPDDVLLIVGPPSNFRLRYHYTCEVGGREVWAVKLET